MAGKPVGCRAGAAWDEDRASSVGYVYLGRQRCASLGGVDAEMARRRRAAAWQWCGSGEDGRHHT